MTSAYNHHVSYFALIVFVHVFQQESAFLFLVVWVHWLKELRYGSSCMMNEGLELMRPSTGLQVIAPAKWVVVVIAVL